MSKTNKEIAELKNAVRHLKLQDLYAICNYANLSRNGRKSELIDRLHQYLDEQPNFAVRMKIKEICRKHGSGVGAMVTRGSMTANGQSTSNEVANSHVQNISSLPNIRPHPGPSTGNPMNYHHQHVPLSGGMQSTTIMRLHQQQLQGTVAVNQTMNSGGTMTGTVHHQNPPMNLTNLPVHPDVRLAPHPFYEQQQNGELMRVKTLMNTSRPFVSKGVYEATFPFHLSPQQANMIFENRVEHIVQKRTDFGIQVLVRFCKYDTSSEQDDALPIHLSLRCNGTPVPLCNPIPTNKPGMDGRRLGRPINITPQVRVSPTVPNFITVNWHFDPNHHLQAQIYALGVYLVKRLSPKDLMNKLNKKGVKPPEFAKYMIKEKMTSSDAEIMTNKLRTSLRCPLGKMRIETPLRAQKCTHLQCFDAYCYLAMNERRPTWRCPFCDQPAAFSDLYIDGFFRDILNSCDSSVSKVEFTEEGAWTVIREDEEEDEADDGPPEEPQRPQPKVQQIPPPPPHQILQQSSEKPQAIGDNNAAGDSSVIDLTEGSDEEADPAVSTSAVGKKEEENPTGPPKRELDASGTCEGSSAKRIRTSPQSPEIICLDSSDEDDDSHQSRPTSPKTCKGPSAVEAPDSTTPASSVNADVNTSNVPVNPLSMSIQSNGGGVTGTSDQNSVFMNTPVQFPANATPMIGANSSVPSFMNTSNNPPYMPGGRVFPGNTNNFYPQ